MPRWFLRNIDRPGRFKGGQISELAFALRENETGLSLTKLPADRAEWPGFIMGRWTASTLPSGDRPALSLIGEEDIARLGLELVHSPVPGNEEHYEIIGVTPDFSEQLALMSTKSGMVAPFLKKNSLKEPEAGLRSEFYLEPEAE